MAEADDATQSKPREGKLRWLLGWIVLPGSLIAALFLFGVHVGARHPDMGLSRLLLKVFRAKPGVAEPSGPPKLEARPGAKPGEPFEYSDTLSASQLRTIADKNLVGVDELACEDVCRAYSKAKHDVAVYSIEHCELGRAVSSAPALMVCRGKLEAVETADAKAGEGRAPAEPTKQLDPGVEP